MKLSRGYSSASERLLLLSLAAVVAAGCTRAKRADALQLKRVAEALSCLAASGGAVGFDDFHPFQPSDFDLHQAHRVQIVWIGGRRDYVCGNDDFECLEVFENLSELVIRGKCSLGNPSDNEIGCPELFALYLYDAEVDLTELTCYAEIRRLKKLDFVCDTVTASSLEGIASMPALEELRFLNVGQFDEGSLNELRDSPLRKLSFLKCHLKGPDLQVLANMPELEELEFGGCFVIGNDAEPYLINCTGLRKLDLRGTDCTADAVDRLRKALPDCEIKFETTVQ